LSSKPQKKWDGNKGIIERKEKRREKAEELMARDDRTPEKNHDVQACRRPRVQKDQIT
jgi:hypothetical protein